MTLVIVSGGIDLAVGSVLALVAVCGAMMASIGPGRPGRPCPPAWPWGRMRGRVRRVATARLRMQPFIATLAMMVSPRGLAKTVCGGMKVSTAVAEPHGGFHDVPCRPVFRAIDSRILGGNLSMVR